MGPLFWVSLRPAKLRGSVTKARRGSGCGGQPAVRLSPHQMPPVPPTSDIIHKFIRDKYSKRFPELESLVPNALDYIRTVKVGAEGLRVGGRQAPPWDPGGKGCLRPEHRSRGTSSVSDSGGPSRLPRPWGLEALEG